MLPTETAAPLQNVMKQFAVLATVLFLGACNKPEIHDSRPNVILVLADDLGYADLGVIGGDVKTPTLDSLAQRGVFVREFYNTAKCSPTRAALLTGRYAHEAGLGGNIALTNRPARPIGAYQGYLDPSVPTIAELLRAQGYKTYMSGKWHVGEAEENWPRKRGFDRYFGLISGASSYYEIIADQPRERVMAHDDTRWMPPPEGFYMTDALADTAISFITQHVAHESSPFFLYLAFTAPHWPLHAPDEVVQNYDGTYDRGWQALHEARTARMVETRLIPPETVPAPMPPDVPAWESLSDAEKSLWARRMQVHAAMISIMDAAISRVLMALETSNQASNTLFLFMSDNGASAEDISGRGLNDPNAIVGSRGSYDSFRKPWAWASVAPFNRYKLNLDEGGIRTPLIAVWPEGFGSESKTVNVPGHIIDIVPTILAAAGIPPPDNLDGVSLLPAWQHGGGERSRTLFWEYSGHRAVRRGSMKALYRNDEAAWSLYDLAHDPGETHDLAASNPALLDSLTAQWDAWADSVGVFDEH